VSTLSNPILLRMAAVLIVSAFAFLVGMLIIRRMRQNLAEEACLDNTTSLEQFPQHVYHAVIQQLKQQKHQLLSEQQIERRRARASENISSAVLSHLSSGVMFFSPNGLVRQANTAARQILGFASPVGMKIEEIFRDANALGRTEASETLADVVRAALSTQKSLHRTEARYFTPAGEERRIDLTVTPVLAQDNNLLGVACLISDRTEIAQVRLHQELRGEMSAEMALQLRSSLATISGYAQQLAANRDPGQAQQLAADIASEAAQLDHTIGGFLAEARTAAATGG